MKNLETIADELFNKIRGRYPSVTVGDQDATITNMPKEGRFFEFDFAKDKKVSISLDEDGLKVMYSQQLFDESDASIKSNWYGFLKELRQFAKKRMLRFDTRDITKNSLDKRDYDYLSTEKQMSESKLYGTSRTSFQDIGSAKMIVKHSGTINQEQPAGRTRDIAGIYIESENGERFKYPMKHLNGARAMARHVSEGGTPYDDFGKHIVGLSEELSKLRKFKTYMNRSSVMAESLAGYLDVVNERIEAVKKTAHALQSNSGYKEAFESFETTVLEEVPEDVSNTWIDELTIKQFNEELKGVFPYIYKLVSEANKAEELGPQDLLGEGEDVEAKVKMMISKSQEPEQAIENLMKVQGPEGDFIRREYEITAGENGLHGDDDHETIIDIMVDDIGVAEDFTQEGKVKGMVMDMEDDAADMSREEFMMKYGNHNADIWDKVNDEDYRDPSDMAPENYDFEPTADAIVSGAEFNQEAPMTEYERAFEDFKMAAANAAAKGEKEFEYPKGSGKKHPTKMDKGTAAKLLADSQTNEAVDKSALEAWYNKYSKYQGNNGDELPAGMLRGYIDTGIMTDGVEANELEKAVKMLGGDRSKAEDELFNDDDGIFAKMLPITDAMQKEFLKIMGVSAIDEENCTEAAKILGDDIVGFGVDEGEKPDGPQVIDISPKGQGDELKGKQETPLDEFVKSMYDYTQNAFPKGETAVLTAVQKKYGDEAVRDAQQVIQELLMGNDEEMARIQQLAGLR